jgi:hypothetical protein
MSDVPPFHQAGDPDGHLFAFTFSRGRYVAASGTTNEPAFLVLYFSNSVDFAPVSCPTTSRSVRLRRNWCPMVLAEAIRSRRESLQEIARPCIACA